MEILLVLLVVCGALYWAYQQINKPDIQQEQPVQPPKEDKKAMDFDNLNQAEKDAVFEYTKNLAADGLTAEEQMVIINKATEIGIPANKILKVIAQSWNGRPDVGNGVTEDVVFQYFKDIDPVLVGRTKPEPVPAPVVTNHVAEVEQPVAKPKRRTTRKATVKPATKSASKSVAKQAPKPVAIKKVKK